MSDAVDKVEQAMSNLRIARIVLNWWEAKVAESIHRDLGTVAVDDQMALRDDALEGVRLAELALLEATSSTVRTYISEQS